MRRSKTGPDQELVKNYQDWLDTYWTLPDVPVQKALGSTTNKRVRSGTSLPTSQQEYADYQKQFAENAARSAVFKNQSASFKKQPASCQRHTDECYRNTCCANKQMQCGYDSDPDDGDAQQRYARSQRRQMYKEEQRAKLREARLQAQLHPSRESRK